MESIINNLKNLLTTYGFEATSIIVLTVIIVNLLKKPIIKYGIRLAARSGYDKSIVTKNISFLPFIIAFLLTLIFALIQVSFKFALINWKEITAASFIYAGLAVSTYEIGKKQLEAYATKVNNKPPLVLYDDEIEEGEGVIDDDPLL